MCEEFRTCKTHALSVYLLLLAGCVIPLFLPVGIVMAHTMRGATRGTAGGAHLDYLITTFWVTIFSVLGGLAVLALGGMASHSADPSFIFVVAAVGLWVFAGRWWIIRLIYGLVRLLLD